MCGRVWGESGSEEVKNSTIHTRGQQEKTEWQGEREMVETTTENSLFLDSFKIRFHGLSLGF